MFNHRAHDQRQTLADAFAIRLAQIGQLAPFAQRRRCNPRYRQIALPFACLIDFNVAGLPKPGLLGFALAVQPR
jgi:hypothetical protein